MPFGFEGTNCTCEGGGGAGRGRPNRSHLILNEGQGEVKCFSTKNICLIWSGFEAAPGSEELGGEARHFAAFAGGEGHVPEAFLARKGLNEDGEGIVRFAHVRGIDLAGVAGEDNLRAFAYAGEDRLQRCGFEVLCLVDDDHLAM